MSDLRHVKGETLKVFIVTGEGFEGGGGLQCVESTLQRAKNVVAGLPPSDNISCWTIVECPVDSGRLYQSFDVKGGYRRWELVDGEWQVTK